MRVSVFGLGYVGCVSAANFAKAGHEVVGVDVNPDKVTLINAGASPVVEPGLDTLIGQVVRAGRLRATSSAEDAVAASDVAMICVGTPGQPNGRLQVTALAGVAEAIGSAARHRALDFTVVLRSTVLPGTSDEVLLPSLQAGSGSRDRFRIAVNPEFMREGSSLQDFAHPPFTLVGSADSSVVAILRSLYAGVTAPFIHTDVRSAEMVKYVSNAFHALKVCFANEVGDLCAALGANAQEVMRVFLSDRKLSVSEAYLRPGFAFGGSCLPKDLRALLYAARQADLFPPLLGAILPANEVQVERGIEAVLATGKRRVGIVGLSFKDRTDDLRESPLVALAEALIGKGCDLRILDGNVAISRLVGANRKYIAEHIPHIAPLMCESVDDLLDHAEVLVLGNLGEDATLALASAGPQHVVVDLARGGGQRGTASHAA
jgi:GDP-mannose 6-dehydrogenase